MIFDPTDKSLLSLASIFLHESIHLVVGDIRDYREQHELQSFELDEKEQESFLEEVFVETLTVLLVAEGDINRARKFLKYHVSDYTAGVNILLDKLELLLLDETSGTPQCPDALCIMLRALYSAKFSDDVKTPWGYIYELYEEKVGDDMFDEILRHRHNGFEPNETVQTLNQDVVQTLVESHINELAGIRKWLKN